MTSKPTQEDMTLRDWFAGRVCSALMTMTSADTDFPNLDYQRHPDVLPYAERVARISYQMADAMLKEREPETDSYVLVVPNKCDRIIWRGSYYHLPLQAEQQTSHPAITHCDNCGCDWLDNGLNPVGCPYCKQNAWRAAFISERTMRYCEGGMAIEQARIHAETETAFISKQYTNREAPDND